MATKYSESAQMGDLGIAHIESVCAKGGLIYRPFEKTDVGVDGAIEFLDQSREPSGDLVLVQAKAGQSFISGAKYLLKTNRSHFETWARYSIPVVGIVYNPSKDDARWVNISEHLEQNPEQIVAGPYRIAAPKGQRFTVKGINGFIDAFRKNTSSTASVATPPNLSIRPWKTSDARPTRALLTSIANNYPDFYSWLGKQWKDPNASKKVVSVGGTIAAYSMWKKKDNWNVKLQTFIVGSRFQGSAVGQHLLYHEIRNWAQDSEIERVYVTISSRKRELIDYFYRFGFRVEGFAANRYPRTPNDAEIVLVKHFVREVVTSIEELESLRGALCRKVWGIPEGKRSSSIFGISPQNFFFPLATRGLRCTLDASDTTVASRIVLEGNAQKVLRSYSDYDLMREFYPLKIYLRGKKYIVVPIRPEYSGRLFVRRANDAELTQLKLRVDHAYYCAPRHSDLAPGDFVLFYETKHGGNVGGAFGTALVRRCLVDEPGKLWEEYRNRGVFTINDIQGHVRDGKSMVIHFDFFEPFTHSVPLDKIRDMVGHNTVFQSLTAIPRSQFRAIVAEGQVTDE